MKLLKLLKHHHQLAKRVNLKQRFDLSDRQAQAVLDMRLARLVNLEVEKLTAELKNFRRQY